MLPIHPAKALPNTASVQHGRGQVSAREWSAFARCRSMERSRKILEKIASASHRVITAANEHADRKDLFSVGRAHFQLEEDMRKVSVACECLASVLPHTPVFDERFKDWLSSDEPRRCGETLHQMERLLQEDAPSAPSRASTAITIRSQTAMKDKIDEAVNLFNSRKQFFHFLFTTDIWNNESGVQHWKSVPLFRDHNIRGRPPVQTDPSITLPERAVRDGGPIVKERRQETKSDETKKKEDVTKLEEILNWLDGLNCAEKQDVTLSLRQPDTCSWLFDTTQYRTWRDTESSFLWLRGKPGAGKSVLASSVIDSIEGSRLHGEFLAFFYCDFRNERATRSAEAMRSILSQLLRQLHTSGVIPGSCIDDLIKEKGRGGATLIDAKQLATFISHLAGLLLQKPLVIVDALDECKDVHQLVQALMVLKSCVRLFVTSRAVHAIMGDLSGLPFISMDDTADELSADIELHVTRELDARPRLRDLDREFKTEIRSVLCTRADGMFRWVQCSIDTLNRCFTRKEVRKALDNLPEGLDETYERILRSIDMNAREGQLARRALVWLVAALRPLYLNELMEGLSINLRTRTLDSDLRPMHNGALLDACGSLVTYVEKTGLIILSHFSVKEYLTGEFTRSHLSQYHVNRELAHLHLIRSCTCYISICLNHITQFARSGSAVTHAPRDSLERENHPHLMFQPLRDYVMDDAPDHFNHLGSHFASVLHDIKILERDTQAHSRMWDNMCMSANRDMHSTTPSWPTSIHDFIHYILIAFGPDSVLHEFLRHAGLRPKEGTNPLVYAASFNKYEHARTLLSRGAPLNRTGWEIAGFYQILPIEVAFWSDNHDIVTLFVAEGSPVPEDTFRELYYRSDQPRIPSPIMRILLQTNDFAEVAQSPLMKAFLTPFALSHCFLNKDISDQDLIVIIRRVIQVGYDPFEVPSRGDTLVRIAAQREQVTVIRYLLSLGVSLPSDLLVTLNLKYMEDATHMVRFLVENGVNTLAHNKRGDSVLHISLGTLEEHAALETARLLVAHHCDPREANSRGETPLHVAVKQGHVSVVQYLRSLDVPLPPDILVTLDLGHGMWNAARMIRYLVDNGVNALARSSGGDSVLHIVLATFDEDEALDTAKILVPRGCDPLEANSDGDTPLCIAVRHGNVSVARYLHSLGGPLSSDLLVPSISLGMPNGAQVIRFLAENDFDVLSRTRMGDSLLYVALNTVHEDEALETAKVLLARGCNPSQANFFGSTPLHIAVHLGHLSVVQYILSHDTPQPSELLATLSSWGSRNRANMFRYLVESGTIPVTHTTDENSLFHTVLTKFDEHDALETTRFLVDCGCDPLEPNSRGETPLRIALKRGHVSVAHYLFSLSVPPTQASGSLTTSSPRKQNLERLFCELQVHLNHSSMYHREREILGIAKLLVAHGCDLLQASYQGKTLVLIAVERENVSLTRYLLSLGAPFPSDQLVAARSRSIRGDARMIRLLVENGVDVLSRTESGYALLHRIDLSDEVGALQTTKLLVARGCDPLQANSSGETLIRATIACGYVFLARHLLSLGARLPYDALLMASRLPQYSTMIHFLIGHGVNVLARRSEGESVLHDAISAFDDDDQNVLDVITSLVHSGCDPAISTTHGITPLHVAVEQGKAIIVKHLISLNAPLPPDIIFTAMKSKSRSRRKVMEVTEILVTSGCDILAHNPAGHTPLYVAVVRGYVDVADYLLSVMGTPPSEDLLSAAAIAPWGVRKEMMSMLKRRLAGSEGPDEPGPPPAKRARYS